MLKRKPVYSIYYIHPICDKFWRKSIFSNGVTEKKGTAFFPARGVKTLIE